MAKAQIVSGKGGGRAIAWIAGIPQGFSRQYVFPARGEIEIADVDAAAILAGEIDTGGRTLEVTVPPKTTTASKAQTITVTAPVSPSAPKAGE